jgi:hypothetical protein
VQAVRGRNVITSGSTTEEQTDLGRAKRGSSIILGLGAGLFMILPWMMFTPSTWAASGQDSQHFSKFLEIPLKGESIPRKLNFPLYEQNNIQYFSAGLGKEERSLRYPPYPLKLIFVKGERAFLAHVAIEVLHPDQTSLLSIPGEEVQGPWLFLNLPAGKYVVKATDSSGTTVERSINLPAKKTTTAYFRWP